jgi:hypothetical protein
VKLITYYLLPIPKPFCKSLNQQRIFILCFVHYKEIPETTIANMANQEEFQAFYETHLKPKLIIFEKQRKNIVRSLIVVLFSYGVLMIFAASLMAWDENWTLELIIVITFISVWILFFYDKVSSFYVVLLLFLIVVIAIYQGNQFWVLTSIILMIILSLGVKFFYRLAVSPYKQNFKKEIVGSITTFIDENLTYDAEKKIPSEEFQASRFFEDMYGRTIDRWTGEDYVEGTLGETAVKLSEVKAEEYETDSEGDNHYNTLFKGLFFIFDFHLDFEGITVILPKYVKPSFLSRFFGKKPQPWATDISNLKLVELTEPEFEREFLVYSDTPIMARYVLSTPFMHRLLIFRHRLNKPVYLSFTNGKLYVAISVVADLFEPTVFRTLLNFTLIQEFFEYLRLGKEIVEDLKTFLKEPNRYLPVVSSPFEKKEELGEIQTNFINF